MAGTYKNTALIEKRRRKGLSLFAVLCDVICSLFLAIILSLVIFLLFLSGRQSLTNLFGNSFIYVLTDSMKPDFAGGDVVFVKNCDPAQLKQGDIIAFYKNNSSDRFTKIYFHRITDIRTDDDDDLFFQTKGDKNKLPDAGWVSADDIIGVYNNNFKFIQRFLSFAVTVEGNIFLIVIPCGIIFMLELVALVNWADQRLKERKALIKVNSTGENTGRAPPEESSRMPPPENSGAGCVPDTAIKEGDKIIIIAATGNSRKKAGLPELLADLEDYKQRPRVTAKMIMKKAILLEKLKNSAKYRYDPDTQYVIREALNWCYGKIGNVKYK